MSQSILKLEQIVKSFGAVNVLKGVDFDLAKGEVHALVGGNGAGKSTFARCLCGLEKHCKGVVNINGNQYNRKQRLSLCYMVMQDVNHQLFTESTEEETGKKSRRIRKNRCKMPGAGTGIWKRFQRSIHGRELCGK